MFDTIKNTILCLLKGSRKIPVNSPFDATLQPLRMDREYGCGLIFLQAGVSGEDAGYLDFLDMNKLHSVFRIQVDIQGNIIGKTNVSIIDAATSNPDVRNFCNRLSVFIQKKNNDYQTYTLLFELFGEHVADEFLAQYTAGIHSTSENTSVKLAILFNHNYIRNVPLLHSLYSKRFSSIDFIFPCVCPDHLSFFAYPFGSYQYHGMITQYLHDRSRSIMSHGIRHIIFIQDDLLLHPSIDERSYTSKLCLDQLPYSFGDLGKYSPIDKWAWIQRVQLAIQNQDSPIGGNGFEGLSPLVSYEHLKSGVADYFAMETSRLELFEHYLRPFVAANVFPEVAIPTVLSRMATKEGTGVARIPGCKLWQTDRKKVYDTKWMKEFLASQNMYLHPVKMSTLSPQILSMLF